MINSSNLYKKEWLNLVFKNRNQNYGAYTLRQQSSKITFRALLISSSAFILLFVIPAVLRHIKPAEIVVPDKIIEVNTLTLPDQVKPEEKKKEMPAEPVKEKIKTVSLPSRPVVVSDPVLKDPPTLKEIEHAAIGPVTQAGVETNIATVPEAGAGNGIGTGKGNGEGEAVDNTIYENGTGSLEAYPEFEGGMKGWAKFLQRNLRYPSMASEQEIQGKVFVSFVVEKDGSVSDVTLVKGIGGGCDEEALRVIKKSPRWKPGQQNGRSVRVRYNMPLSFTINQ
nr:energy transducer TonB [Pedobacter sp. ASV19]